jgi:hypothetical protein
MKPFYTAYEMCCGTKPLDKVAMIEFIQHAKARELQEFILLGKDKFGIAGAFNREWLEQAEISMHVRIGEENIAAANTITKQLTEQTETLVTESRKLTSLTETLCSQNTILVKESQKLGRITWGLFYLTVILALLTAALLFIDWQKEKSTAKNTAVETPVSR